MMSTVHWFKIYGIKLFHFKPTMEFFLVIILVLDFEEAYDCFLLIAFATASKA